MSSYFHTRLSVTSLLVDTARIVSRRGDLVLESRSAVAVNSSRESTKSRMTLCQVADKGGAALSFLLLASFEECNMRDGCKKCCIQVVSTAIKAT